MAYKGKDGCPIFSTSKFMAFMSKYYYIWGIIMIVIGLFMAFAGTKFVEVVIYIVATVATFLIGSAIFFSLFLSNVKKEWV